MDRIKELKAEAYDTLAIIEQHEINVQNYTNTEILPLKRKLSEINKEIAKLKTSNETGGSDTSVQG